MTQLTNYLALRLFRGLKFVAQQRRARLLAIAEWISQSSNAISRSSYHSDGSDEGAAVELAERNGYDVIALQEIWVRADFEVVAARAKEAGLLYSRFFYSGAIGSGLAILSAHPISSSFIFPYPLNGYPLHFIEGDFYAGKAVCGITIDLGEVGKVDILNTHLYAPGGEGDGIDGAHRVAQAWELARIITEKVERGRHCLLMGDLNSQPDSIILRILKKHGSVHDAFALTHPPAPSITSSTHLSLSPREKLHVHGITCDSPLNSYSAPKLINKSPHDEIVVRGGKRLDYILFRSPLEASHHLVANSSSVVLTGLIPKQNVSYSDHFGLESTLSFNSNSNNSSQDFAPYPAPLSSANLSTAIANLKAQYAHSLASSHSQLKLLGLALFLAPALAIAASFQPLRYLGWLFVLLGVGVGAGGATMLYSGFVGGQWEAGALRNVIGEMEAHLETLEGGWQN